MNKKGVTWGHIISGVLVILVVVVVITIFKGQVFAALKPLLGLKITDIGGYRETYPESATSFGNLINTFQYCGVLDEGGCYCELPLNQLPQDTYTFTALNEKGEPVESRKEAKESKTVVISAESSKEKSDPLRNIHLGYLGWKFFTMKTGGECKPLYLGGEKAEIDKLYDLSYFILEKKEDSTKIDWNWDVPGLVNLIDNIISSTKGIKQLVVFSDGINRNIMYAKECSLEELKFTKIPKCKETTPNTKNIMEILKLIEYAVRGCAKKTDAIVCEFIDFKERSFDDPKLSVKQIGKNISLWYGSKKIDEIEAENICPTEVYQESTMVAEGEFKGGEGIYLVSSFYHDTELLATMSCVALKGQETYSSIKEQISGLGSPLTSLTISTLEGLGKIYMDIESITPAEELSGKREEINAVYFGINLKSENEPFKEKLEPEYISNAIASFTVGNSWVDKLPEDLSYEDVRLYYYDEGAWKTGETYYEKDLGDKKLYRAYLNGFSTEFAIYAKPEKIWPLDNPIITSCYGWRTLEAKERDWHDGFDLSASVGTEVKAVDSGNVIETCTEKRNTYPGSGNCRGYGTYLIIKHYDGTYTKYSHLSDLLVEKGDNVIQGQAIAKSGNTGYSEGPHLDFKVYYSYGFAADKGKPSYDRDPLKYLPGLPLYAFASTAESCKESPTVIALKSEGEAISGIAVG